MHGEDEGHKRVDSGDDDQLDVSECRDGTGRPLYGDEKGQERGEAREQRQKPGTRDEPVNASLADERHLGNQNRNHDKIVKINISYYLQLFS